MTTKSCMWPLSDSPQGNRNLSLTNIGNTWGLLAEVGCKLQMVGLQRGTLIFSL